MENSQGKWENVGFGGCEGHFEDQKINFGFSTLNISRQINKI